MSETAHVVSRIVGTYETTETVLCAFRTEAEATLFAAKADEEWAAAVSAVPDRADYPDDDAPDGEWVKWKRRRLHAWKRFRALLRCDPDAAPDGEWASPGEPTYFVTSVPLFASAIEARRDAESEAGAVEDESAAAKPDVQSQSGDSPCQEG